MSRKYENLPDSLVGQRDVIIHLPAESGISDVADNDDFGNVPDQAEQRSRRKKPLQAFGDIEFVKLWFYRFRGESQAHLRQVYDKAGYPQ